MSMEGPAQRPRLDVAAARRALSEHRIVKIETRQLHDRYPRQVGRNAKRGSHGNGGTYQVRRVTTDKGATGWAMAHATDEQVGPFIGACVSDLFDVERGTVESAFALDLPVHDLAGRILGLPAYALLGSAGPMAMPIYSGAICFDDLDPEGNPRGLAAVVANCQQDYAAGYRAFKLKIGRGFKWMPREEGIQRDIAVTRAVRERFADCKILVDANDGYTCADFLRYLNGVADCGLYWIEEPFVENRDDLVKLREGMAKLGCRALIAEGEGRAERAEQLWRYGGYTQEHIERLYALAAEKLVDVFLLDLGIVGFTRWRHIMPELVRAGVKASPHTWGWIPRPYYVSQLAAGRGNVVIVEGIPGHTPGVDYSAYRFVDGNLVIPNAPGFGMELQA